MSIHNLKDGDYTYKVFGDNAAFLAIVDIDTYDIYDYDWDYHNLNERLTTRINLKKAIAWGCPQDEFQIRITQSISEEEIKQSFNSFSQNYESHGVLSLSNYTSLTMCAQFDDFKLPQPEDGVFSVKPNGYLVTIYQMFAWETGQQFAEKLNQGDNYIIVFKKNSFAHPKNTFTKIPWSY